MDDRAYREWQALLAQDIVYRIPLRTAVSRKDGTGFDHSLLMNDTWATIDLRVRRLMGDYAWAEDPPSRTRPSSRTSRSNQASSLMRSTSALTSYCFERSAICQCPRSSRRGAKTSCGANRKAAGGLPAARFSLTTPSSPATIYRCLLGLDGTARRSTVQGLSSAFDCISRAVGHRILDATKLQMRSSMTKSETSD